MLTISRRAAGALTLAALMTGPVVAADKPHQAELRKCRTRISKLESRLAALPRDTEVAQRAADGMQRLLEVAKRYQDPNDIALAKAQVDLAERMMAIAEGAIAAATSAGVQP